MSRITLNMNNDLLDGAAEVDQEWIISLLRPDEFTLPAGGQALSRSPGIVVVIPLEGVESFLVVGDSTHLFPGTACVLNGTACERLSYPESAEAESNRARVGVIELNMSFSDTRGLLDVISVPAQLNSHLSEEAVRLHLELTRVFQGGSSGSDEKNMIMYMLAAQLVCVLLQSKETVSSEAVHGGNRAEELKRLLSSELDKNLTTADMAAHFKMSRASFAYWSKQVLGTTPARYRRIIRLEYSQELLQGSSHSIEEIVAAIGFSDRYHFSKAFKKEFGVSPAKFRRTRAKTAPAPTPYILFKQNQYSKALELCDKALRTVDDKNERQRLHYLRFQCLEALGRIMEATEAWERLKGTATVHVAGMQFARSLFEKENYEESLKLLKDAIQSERETDRDLAIQVWMDHIMSLIRLRQRQPLRDYLDMRKDLFVRDVKSIPLAGYALYLLGDLKEAEYHVKESRDSLSRLYYQMGKYDSAIDTAGPERRAPIIKKVKGARGEKDEAEDITVGHLELLSTEEGAQKILEESDPDTGGHIYALHALGRFDELRNYSNEGTFFWHYAQLYGNPEALLNASFTDSPSFVHSARLLLLLDALEGGKDADVEKYLSECQDISSPEFFWEDQKFLGVLLNATIRGLVVNSEIAKATWTVIRESYRYADQQTAWYAAGFLLDEMTENEYLEQPKQEGILERLELLKAVKLDLSGDSKAAKALYGNILKRTSPYQSLILYRFLKWRCSS